MDCAVPPSTTTYRLYTLRPGCCTQLRGDTENGASGLQLPYSYLEAGHAKRNLVGNGAVTTKRK